MTFATSACWVTAATASPRCARACSLLTKAITRLGKRADGTTVSDFDDEEKKRQYSISTSVIPVEYNELQDQRSR